MGADCEDSCRWQHCDVADQEPKERIEPLTGAEGRRRLLDGLLPFVKLATDYAREVIDGPMLADAGSTAMKEVNAEHLFATDEWLRPAHNAHSYGCILAVFLADHLSAFAASCTAPYVGPTYAHLTLLRPIVESAPVAHWLLDPDATVLHRVQRAIIYRWDSAFNLKRNSHLPSAVEGADDDMAKIKRYLSLRVAASTRSEWSWTGEPKGGGLIVGEQRLPHPDGSFARLLFGRASTFDRTLWNYLSAAGHGTFYALREGLSLPADASADSLDPDSTVRGYVVDSRRVMQFGLIGFRAVDAVVRARDALMGWTSSAERDAAAQALYELDRDLA